MPTLSSCSCVQVSAGLLIKTATFIYTHPKYPIIAKKLDYSGPVTTQMQQSRASRNLNAVLFSKYLI